MKRSFFVNILALLAFEMIMITVAFYTTGGIGHQLFTKTVSPVVAGVTADAEAKKPEVLVLWSAPEAATPAIYTVIRHDLNRADEQTIIATIDTTEMKSYAGYYRVEDDRNDGGQYAYEVISVSNTGTKVVTSVALAV